MPNLTLGQAGSIWQQFSSFFFLTAGLFNDLLCVRTSLTMSYIFLVIVGFMGAPRFMNSFQPTGIVSVDTIIWAVLNLFVHANSVYCMLRDERNIELTEDEETLWRMIYRHSGLSKLQFKVKLCPHVEVVNCKAGEELDMAYFYIILDGVIGAEAFNGNTGQKHVFPMCSGQAFPLQHIYACTQSRSIEAMSVDHTFASTWINPVPFTNVKMYRFSAQFLEQLSKNMNAKETWLAFLSTIMASVAIRPYYDDTDMNAFVSDRSNAHLTENRSPLFDKLAKFEEPNRLAAGSTTALRRPVLHILNSYRLSFWVPWPIGIWPQGLRHRLPPPKDPNVKKSMNRKTMLLQEHILLHCGDALEDTKAMVRNSTCLHKFSTIAEFDEDDEEKEDDKVPYGTFSVPEGRTSTV
mmetsp:Transcript_11315/g.18207  ORF Transcript_11315/g.18207 Transcript_11315/m.18207 type:complete len:407 (-) Transcript_11315:67-1287(-)